MDITKMSLVELKALAYDRIGQMETVKNDLSIINQRISVLIQQEKKTEPQKKENEG